MEIVEKEVRFDLYCYKCKFHLTKEEDEPCRDCLNYPSNSHSKKPLRYKEDEHARVNDNR